VECDVSDSWDEKHARNKGAAKNAFEEKASDAPKEELSSDLLKALEGLNDRRSGVADRRNSDIHRIAQELDDEAQQEEEAELPELEKPRPRPPSLSLGGETIRPAPKYAAPERDDAARDRMRALLQRGKEQDRERDR
tara:strand:+ start:16328 stop:16738 length:411 start_codon:yes stop_codon:yes gene_type:complete